MIQYLENLMELLLSPVGIAGVLLLVMAGFLAASFRAARWWIIAFLMIVTMLVAPSESPDEAPRIMSFPMNIAQNFSRPLAVLTLAILMIPALSGQKVMRWRYTIPSVAIAYLVFELAFSFRYFLGGEAILRAVLGVVVFAMLFIVLAYGASRWLQTIEDAIWLVRSIVISGGLFALGSMYQAAISMDVVFAGGRFMGITANPQAAGIYIPLVVLACAYLLLSPSEKKTWKLIAAMVGGIMIMFILATGSRTAGVMTVMGLVLMFRFKVGRFFIVGAVLLVCLFIGLQFFEGSIASGNRLLNTQDTRGAVWSHLLNQFLANPLLGIGKTRISENSYLVTLANNGIFGGIFLAVFIYMTLREIMKMVRNKVYLGRESLLADYSLGSIAALATGALFEGFLLGTLTPMVILIYLHITLLSFVTDAAAFQKASLLQAQQYAMIPPQPHGPPPRPYAQPAPT